jgi:pimeloyl-ACP methyl ester carboxylesterase
MKNGNISPVSEDIIHGSEKLFFFFGGIAGAIGMPPFEFYRASRILNHSRIFLRDHSQSWYQRGLPAMGDNAYAVGTFLQDRIRQSDASKIYFVGNSMGGYAAFLFCAMLQLGNAIVFSPQTFVSSEKRLSYGDDRWAEQIRKLHETHTSSDILELKSWIQDRFPHMPARVYVSTSDVLDMHHVNELASFPNIKIC